MADLLVPFAGDSAPELAERLIGRFGSLGRALAASPRQLHDAAKGHEQACAAILGARRLVDAALGEDVVRSPVRGDEDALHRYLRARLAWADTEMLHVVFCDTAGGYLADETVCEGSSGRIEARARPLIERALALGAAGFLLAHNHPSGVCRPSREDIAGTRRISDIAAALELELIDHLIVTRRSVYSMRAGGCL
ncbi:JAB domain-containing protein [Tsuneonella sp. YG55]|uniref:JAB domain-containing protein n=1 Tax=Tsuneonella litorea TaxID=2976475 RepID=A0A9X2W1Q7_9SPHN|nr:JAB domain-containing protein [Tsuneonella litorea]MCT2559191.1 JAB domain-containing protein [Tsuneonella litorea]